MLCATDTRRAPTMAGGALVLILLLDYVPENTSNTTLADIAPLGPHITNLRQCGQTRIIDPIIRIINKQLNIKIIPKWKSERDIFINFYLNSSDAENESDETLYQLQTVLDNSVENSNSYEKLLKFVELNKFAEDKNEYEFKNTINKAVNKIGIEEKVNNSEGTEVSFAPKVNDSNGITESRARAENYSEGTKVSLAQKGNYSEGITESLAQKGNDSNGTKGSNVSLVDKVKFPAKLESLVAIFETVGNVTAQTCGGILVSPHWVLTAASCINVLGNMYNMMNQSSQSQYTVVANATNPLVDGSVHRVRRVALRTAPDTVASLIRHLHDTFVQSKKEIGGQEPIETKIPAVALMRVEPAVLVGVLELLAEPLAVGTPVAVYGWVLTKNASGDSMHASSFPAETLDPLECERRHGPAHALCLDTATDIAKEISHMSSGGAVLRVLGGRAFLAGVAQADDRALLAFPLADHARWIARVIHDDNTRDHT